MKWGLFCASALLAGFLGAAVVQTVAEAPKPQWTGKDCPTAWCVTQTLNDLYPESAKDAKVVPYPTCMDGNCSHFWVFYHN